MTTLTLALAALLTVTVPTAAAPRSTPHDWVARTLERLSLRDKVAQMVMPWIPGGAPTPGSPEWRRARRLVTEEHVGGLIVGRGRALAGAAWLNELQEASRLPLLVGADLEWGAGTRLDGATVLPVNMAIAAAGDASLAYEAGRITAHEARAAGIHLAFAPVADVNVNPDNPVINTRSYGADPEAVAARVAAFVEGARAGGLLTVAKHFPGHGDTEHDSHLTLPRVPASPTRLETVELVPFRAAIEAGVTGIMTAHLAVPALEPGDIVRPATLSRPILTDLLRRELGFNGLVITDALTMDGVRRGRDAGELAVEAVRAGADILLQPPDAEEAIDAVVAAVRAGTIAEARIDRSVRRILQAKMDAGLVERRTVDLWNVLAVLGNPAHERWAQRTAERSLTLVRSAPGALPLELDRGAVPRVLSIAYADSRRRPVNEVFDRALARQGAVVESVRLWRRSSRAALRRVERAAAEADVVIFSTHARAVPWKGRLGLPRRVAALADRLAARGAVVVNFGDPYVLKQLPRAQTYLLAWSGADVVQRAAVRALTGRVAIAGRLPIPLPPQYAVGDGIVLPLFGNHSNVADDTDADDSRDGRR